MRVYTKSGDLAFRTFNFSDNQPHFVLETYEREFDVVTVEMAIKNPSDLFLLLLCTDVLRTSGYSDIRVDIRYLLGARMDRAISSLEPFTLHTVARLVNGCGFTRVRILDAHSEVATRLIRNSENLLPTKVVEQVKASMGHCTVVCPDKGATVRTRSLAGYDPVIYCAKVRDMSTGALSGFKVDGPNLRIGDSLQFLIIDDICDGGGTFVGLAKELRAWAKSQLTIPDQESAIKINLFVTHGIFSKGLPLEGIDKVFTTDSYTEVDKISVHVPNAKQDLVVIPISMEKL